MTSLLRSPRVRGGLLVLSAAVLSAIGLAAPTRTARAQSADRMLNTGTVTIKYKAVGTLTWLSLTPGQSVDITSENDLLNDSFSTGQLTMQRATTGVYSNALLVRLDPNAQGTYAPVGVICTIGKFVVTQYQYLGQYIGNLYGRAFLTHLTASPGSAPRRESTTATNPVLTLWGYASYSGGARLEVTTMSYLETGGTVILVGSTDPTCLTYAYAVAQMGDYINWNISGVVTARSMNCVNATSFPAVAPWALAALGTALAGLAAIAARRARRSPAA